MFYLSMDSEEWPLCTMSSDFEESQDTGQWTGHETEGQGMGECNSGSVSKSNLLNRMSLVKGTCQI